MADNERRKQDTEAVLLNYSVKTYHIEFIGNITKLYSDKGVFALKSIDPHIGIDFIRNIQRLYQRGYNRIVPIYQTMDGRYAVLHNNRLYYLMPWLSDQENGERSERNKQMFRELARMHTLSVREITVEAEEREEHYQSTNEEWKKQLGFLREFVESCEKKWYMSPFELMYCTYYTDLSQALEYSTKKLEDWYEKTKDHEKIRTVVTHGKVSLKHYVYDDRGYGYFINFENSRTAPPHFDLLPYLVEAARTYPFPCDDCVDLLYNYMRYFPLKPEEVLLFQSYLAYPESSIAVVKGYVEKKGNRSELQYVRHFQRQYWLVKNIEYMVMKIEENERAKKAAAEAQQQQQQQQQEPNPE
ncbi:spore coat protein YsxE [Peribacillus huizhouensis]|uniref:Spore coat protein YsxE n=1 Tax=Peribacillus huizhouensis TaxID=1501239 RepID=A0ABR6CM63_9BACI|nr:spore coat protein YsxE [Peribacillus huizhouensis]MBA9025753.1 spore coat protein YsxE [Peribacillus huizhouensis]